MELFLCKKGNPNQIQTDDDVISLISFIAQLPPEIPFNMDVFSKILADSIQFYTESNSLDFHQIYRDLLKYSFNNNYILMKNYRIYLRNRSIFGAILLTSLKFNRKLFGNDGFIYFVIELILKSITIPNSENLHVLKLLENIYRKREDILNDRLCLMTLKTMNKVACLPIFGFKRCANDISKIAIRNLSEDYNYLKYQICYYPVNCINSNDILNLIKKSDLEVLSRQINDNVIKSFFYNVESREGSFYYQTLISLYDFDEFKRIIWPIYCPHFKQFEEGEFCNSLLKYWLPITVKYFGADFYVFIKHQEISYILKAYTLLEIKQRKFCGNEFDLDILNFLQYPKTNVIGLNMISSYLKKNQSPSEFDLKLVLLFLKNYSNDCLSSEIIKIIKRIFSQIFLTSHINLSKSIRIDLELYQRFFRQIFQFCFNRITVEYCQIVSQLVKILLDISYGPSDRLVLNYKLDQENSYEIKSNLFYKHLVSTNFWNNTFFSSSFIKKFECFLKKFQHYSNFDLIELISIYYLPNFQINFSDIRLELLRSSQFVSLQNLENNQSYFKFFVKYLNFHKYDFTNDLNYLKRTYIEHLSTLQSKSLFLCVVILNILREIRELRDFDIVELLEKSLQVFCNLIQNDFVELLDIKTIKALEALINTVVDCLFVSKNGINFDKNHLLENLTVIIKRSNMKKPVTKTINLVQYFGNLLEENDENRVIKMKLFDNTLKSINTYPERHQSKIRRNPETRLVLHALMSTGNRKVYINWSLSHLLEPYERETAIVSALHCLELLISDSACHQLTLPHIPMIMNHCIEVFLSQHWMIRNANLQLVKALIERLLGVAMDYQNRPKCIEDIFVIFPKIVPIFYGILTKSPLDERTIVVLLFFSESQLKNNVLRDNNLKQLFNNFRDLFLYIIENYSNHYGLLAVKSFTSLCLDDEIPEIIGNISSYIRGNFGNFKTTILSNYIKVLQELYNKKSCKETALHISNLLNFFKNYNNFHFNLLSIKLYNVESIEKQIYSLQHNYFESRILLINYIPYLINNLSDLAQLSGILKYILNCEIPVELEVKILSIIVEKSLKTPYLSVEIFEILIGRLKTFSKSDYLSACYSKSILLFSEFDSTLDLSKLVDHISCDFRTDNIYKIIVYVLVLSYCEEKDRGDLIFLNRALRLYTDNIKNDDILNDLASTIIYLYKASPLHNRYSIFKLVFYLLLNIDSSVEICKFISYLTGKKRTNILASLYNFLDVNNLNNCLNNTNLTKKLLLEFYEFTTNLSDVYEQSCTFYLIENDLSLTKRDIRHVIKKNLLKL